MKSPLTSLDNCIIVKRIDPNAISKRWHGELGVLWNPPQGIDSILYCLDEATGLYFYLPVESAGGSHLYAQLEHFPWYYMDEKWEFNAALQLLHTLPFASRLLEIGVGHGAFLEKGRKDGFNICGMELNPAGAQAAKDKGFTIIEKDMSALRAEDNSPWDAICAFQVLEHLPNPRLFFDQAISLLKPGGLLILSVPNAEVARKLDPERNDLLDQPPHHMTHWDEGVFRSLESFLPLKLKSVAFEPLAQYHISWFVGSWSRRLRSKVGQFIGMIVLNRLSMPLVEGALKMGLRSFVRGHTLLVCFEKTEAPAK
jgi:SAM-dependent methyltransferase